MEWERYQNELCVKMILTPVEYTDSKVTFEICTPSMVDLTEIEIPLEILSPPATC